MNILSVGTISSGKAKATITSCLGIPLDFDYKHHQWILLYFKMHIEAPTPNSSRLFPSELKQILFKCLVNLTFGKAKHGKDGGLPIMFF